MNAGFIGLGTMGLPMAKNLLKKIGSLTVADVVLEKKEEMRALGATIAENNSECAKACDVVFLSLPSLKIVETVMNEILEAAHEGLYVIDTSTVGYVQSKALSEKAALRGVTYIDAPVSGGAGRASEGTLSFIIGATCPELHNAGIDELIGFMGNNIHYAATRGGGVALKILNNMLSKAILFATGEAIMISEKMGIPFDTFYKVVQTSSSQNEIFRIKKEHIEFHEYDPTGKSYASISPITMKDLLLARELSDELSVANFTCNTIIQWYRIAMQNGKADKDSSYIVEMLRNIENEGVPL